MCLVTLESSMKDYFGLIMARRTVQFHRTSNMKRSPGNFLTFGMRMSLQRLVETVRTKALK